MDSERVRLLRVGDRVMLLDKTERLGVVVAVVGPAKVDPDVDEYLVNLDDGTKELVRDRYQITVRVPKGKK